MPRSDEAPRFKLAREVRVRVLSIQPDTYLYFFDQLIEPTTSVDGVEESWRYLPRAFRYDLLSTIAFFSEGDLSFVRTLRLIQAVFAVEGVEKEMIHVGLNFIGITHVSGVPTLPTHDAVIQAAASVIYENYVVTYDVDIVEHWHHLQPLPVAIPRPAQPA